MNKTSGEMMAVPKVGELKTKFVNAPGGQSMKEILTVVPKQETKKQDNTKYVYYTKEGEFLGGNENSEKIYIVQEDNYNDAKKIIIGQ